MAAIGQQQTAEILVVTGKGAGDQSPVDADDQRSAAQSADRYSMHRHTSQYGCATQPSVSSVVTAGHHLCSDELRAPTTSRKNENLDSPASIVAAAGGTDTRDSVGVLRE